MGSHDDPRETSRVLHNGDGVDLFQPLVDHTGTTHVGKAGGASIAFTKPVGSSTHVQSRKGYLL